LLIPRSLLPTPLSGESSVYSENLEKSPRRTPTLATMAARSILPTPTALDNRDRGRLSDPCNQRRIKKGKQIGLTVIMREMGGETSQLNPLFVAEMMGFPPDWTVLPFQNGETNQSKHMGMQ
jgi:hypothetical protein